PQRFELFPLFYPFFEIRLSDSCVQITKFIDLPSGEIRWETDQIGIDALPMIALDGNLILAGLERIAKIDAKSGNVMWSYDVSEKKQTFEKFDVSLDLTTGYFFEKKKNTGQLIALNLSTGSPIWSVEYKLAEVPQMFAIKDGVVVVDSKFFSLYDLQSGATKWETKIKDINYVVDVGAYGIAVAAKDKQLILLDRNDGSVKWEEKVKGINIDQMVGKGIMYTDEKGRLGIITYDGEKVWANKGMLPTPSLRYRAAFDIDLMYADGDLYEVDLNEGTYNVLKGKIDKEFKDDQVPESIELVEGGYLLSSANNLMMLETDGSVRFNQNWPAPGLSLAAKIALRTMQVAAVAMAVSASAQSAQARNNYGSIPMDNYYSKMYAQQADDWMAIAGAAGSEAKKKFTATKEKGDLKVILSLVGEGGQGKASGLVKVDKRTGEELGRIQLGDKEPIYDFDPISGQVFHKASKTQIISYSF
ncbi:MAG: PQQ-binding-like beta-propeller repeat protein, partial [Bacteroidetes bacterium]|nr:PQQ-binding-like beta-propeller repeat protein [Bacteroidota bacterium]MDA1120980.1 PQQ-binding-like beta-propeller repeat protein [Bacteroidota bacterium]